MIPHLSKRVGMWTSSRTKRNDCEHFLDAVYLFKISPRVLAFTVFLAIVPHVVSAFTLRDDQWEYRKLQSPSLAIDSKAPNVQDKRFAITVDFEMKSDDEGVLITGGDASESYSLEVRAGTLIWIYESVFPNERIVRVSAPLPARTISVRLEFGPCYRTGSMFVNGRQVVTRSVLLQESDLGALSSGFQFTGIIRGVSFQEINHP